MAYQKILFTVAEGVATITPTYTGCAAMDVMAADIKKEMLEAGVPEVEVKMNPLPCLDHRLDHRRRKTQAQGIRHRPAREDRRHPGAEGRTTRGGLPTMRFHQHGDALRLRQHGLQGAVEV